MTMMILCIGNRDSGDDAIGPYIADKITKEHPTLQVIDGGTMPENYTSIVKQHHPQTLLIIDAAEMGLPPGTLRRIPKEHIGTMHMSTHGMPLALLIDYLEHYIQHVVLIGIQPQTTSGPLSMMVKKSGDHLIQLIQQEKIETIKVFH